MGFGDNFHFYQYLSDDTSTYAIKLSDAVASQGGFATKVSPKNESVWPFGHRALRYVQGKESGGRRAKIPIFSNSSALYTTGGTFTLHGLVYTIDGAIGEKQRANHIG